MASSKVTLKVMISSINLDPIVNEVRREIESRLDGLGLFYRVFARGKSVSSITHKMQMKKGVYNEQKKMQDIIGVRIVLYFIEDVGIVYDILKSLPHFLEESNSEKDTEELEKNLDDEFRKKLGRLSDKLFMPERLNLIFRMSSEQSENLSMALSGFEFANMIDNTYEVQIRSVFSEGWHEVEHDLRYKCKDEAMWDYCLAESRALNGMYASLEMVESSMRSLFDRIAFKNFKHNDWPAMLRNKFCIRFDDDTVSDDVSRCLSADGGKIGKEVFKFSRADLFSYIRTLPGKLPRKMDNVVYLINRVSIHNEVLASLEPVPVRELLDAIPRR